MSHRLLDKKARVLELLRKDPELTPIQIAERLGTTSHQVARWAKDAGLQVASSVDGLSNILKKARER